MSLFYSFIEIGIAYVKSAASSECAKALGQEVRCPFGNPSTVLAAVRAMSGSGVWSLW
jgi:hypothetical protein